MRVTLMQVALVWRHRALDHHCDLRAGRARSGIESHGLHTPVRHPYLVGQAVCASSPVTGCSGMLPSRNITHALGKTRLT